MKRAALVFFYFGDRSYLTSFGQDIGTPLGEFKHYDHVILLHENESRAKDINAKEWALPSKESFVRCLDSLRAFDGIVDLFIFSHGWNNRFRVRLDDGTNGSVSQDYILNRVRPMTNFRAVWQMNCHGSTLNDCWMELGAKIMSGSKEVNFYPTRWMKFNNWIGSEGETYKQALARSDAADVRTLVQTYILGDAAATTEKWSGTLVEAATVLANTSASRRYFAKIWPSVTYIESGRKTMNASSEILVQGTDCTW